MITQPDSLAAYRHVQEVFEGQPTSTILMKSRRAACQAFMYGVAWQQKRVSLDLRYNERHIALLTAEISNLKGQRMKGKRT